MNHWAILGLAIVAMVATVVVFMWWWTTENWDWASAELKPPRTVPQEPGPVTVARRLAHHWQMLETLSDLSEIQTEQRKKLEQRVTALEERTGMLEEIENQIHSINPPLQGLSSPDSSPDTETPGDPQNMKTPSYSELFPASQGGTPTA
jgi:hypothetical protein